MTVVPNFWITGVLAIAVSLVVILFAATLRSTRGGFALIGLSVLLLLVGGGFLPPLLGIAAGAIATRIRRPSMTPEPQKSMAAAPTSGA